jgi:hypothetical protein
MLRVSNLIPEGFQRLAGGKRSATTTGKLACAPRHPRGMQDGPISVIPPDTRSFGSGLPVVALRLPPANFLNPFGIETRAMAVAKVVKARQDFRQFSYEPKLLTSFATPSGYDA